MILPRYRLGKFREAATPLDEVGCGEAAKSWGCRNPLQ